MDDAALGGEQSAHGFRIALPQAQRVVLDGLQRAPGQGNPLLIARLGELCVCELMCALNDSQPIPVTIEKILNEVARTYNVMPSDIRGKKRNANVSAARQMTMYIIREVTGMSMEAIGQEFQRDHSTVVYSIKTMEENIKRDQHLKEMCSDIMKNVRT